jgi:hypothetical protein
MTEQERLDAIDHQNTLKSIQVVMSMGHGRNFIKYLFKNFCVGDYPPVGIKGEDLLEYMSYLRAGNSIYKIVLEAAPDLTGQLITEIEKGRQDAERKPYVNESSDGE